MLAFVVVCIAMGQGADEFLGTRGDPWDTQSDMFMALVGAVTALALPTRLHDRQIAALTLPPVDQKLWRKPRS